MKKPIFEYTLNNQVTKLPGRKVIFKIRSAIGKALHYFIKPYQDQLELTRLNYVLRARSPGNELGKEEVEALGRYQTSTFDIDLRKKYFRKSEEDGVLESRTLHGLVISLIEKVLKADSSVKSVVNVGCNYAFIDYLLSKKFQDVKFVGIDVPKTITSINDDLIRDNLIIISGYALSLLKDGKLEGDLFYFSSTG